MKVKELIAKLQKYDEELEVEFFDGCDNDRQYTEITRIGLDILNKNKIVLLYCDYYES